VLKLGRRINKVAFYDRTTRRGEVNLSGLSTPFPFALVLPQAAFEELLAARLATTGKTTVQWSHRLSGLEIEGSTVVATVDRMGETAKGYIVTEWDWCVEETKQFRASFVIGADGSLSSTRKLLNIGDEVFGEAGSFAVYEFDQEGDPGHEVHVVLDKAGSVLWPLAGNRCRWSFGMAPAAAPSEFPAKERAPWRFLNPESDASAIKELETFIRQRAPWYKGRVTDVEWSLEVDFKRRLAKQFGRGRCWLAGDAVHQTSPVGMQSMNLGLHEAEVLAGRLKAVASGAAPLSSLDSYDVECRTEWQRLLSAGERIKAKEGADPWLREHAAMIPGCLPVSGDHLIPALGQLGLELTE
jgi:2-polyprenyl-6-methoxyphenol hydroxylase-like FAD-dependent oxidoreductase